MNTTTKMIEIINYIDRNDLKAKHRYRHYVYKRCYLYNMLRQEGLTFSQIGSLFNKNHATVLHGLRTHQDLMAVKDHIYLEYVEELRVIFDNHSENYDLIYDILNCYCLQNLKKIKMRIRNNLYKDISLPEHIVCD